MGFFDRRHEPPCCAPTPTLCRQQQAEDPAKILDQSVADMQADLVKLRQAVALAIASQKRSAQPGRAGIAAQATHLVRAGGARAEERRGGPGLAKR